MDEMTQQNAALVEQAAAAAASLHQQTEQLKQAVSVFEISESVLRTQQPGAMSPANAEFAFTGMHAL
jgi:methyl-accepting chemotaxis protein-2 (aspartate sensor receptor)